MRIIEVDDPVKIILAKQEVEQKLMDEKKLDAPMSLQDFVKSLNMQNNIYIKNDDVIPFSIVDDKLFIIASKEKIEEVNSALKAFVISVVNVLETILKVTVFVPSYIPFPVMITVAVPASRFF